MSTIFRNEEARATIAAAYERFRASARDAEPRTVSTRFGETHALCAGRVDGPPIVLLHGALASSAHIMREVGPLLERFRIYAVDVIGQSVKSADVRLSLDGPDYADWLVDVLDGLELPRAHVYGVSWGGFVARKLAEAHPERIDKLVLMVPAGIVSGSAWKGLSKVAIPMALYRAFPSEARLRRFANAFLTTEDDDAWVQYFGEALRCYNVDIRLPPLATAESLAAFDRPTLVFGASEDVSFPGERLIERAKVLLPHAEVELLEACRHSPPTDDASRARICDRVARFLLA